MGKRSGRKRGRERTSAEVLVHQLVQDVLRLAGLRLGIRVMPERGSLTFRVYLWGEDLELLQASEGLPWNALEFLLRQMASRALERSVTLHLQATEEDPRKKQLQELALRMAERVARTRQPVELEPMPAWERREIHLVLQEHPHVFTRSVGKEPNRRVRILPKEPSSPAQNRNNAARRSSRRRRKRPR